MSGCSSSHRSTRARTNSSVSAGVAGSLVNAVPAIVTYHMAGPSAGNISPEVVCPLPSAAVILFPRYSTFTCSILSVPGGGRRGGCEGHLYRVVIGGDHGDQQPPGAFLRVGRPPQFTRRAF